LRDDPNNGCEEDYWEALLNFVNKVLDDADSRKLPTFLPAGKTVDTGNTDQRTAKESFKRLDRDNDGKLNKVSIQ